MGKSKHKDKSERKTGNGISEDEERRKMRESILKIFHERAQSPEGAVLVNTDIKSKALKSSKSKSLNEARFAHQCRDESSPEESSPYQCGDERSPDESSPSHSEKNFGNRQTETRKRKRRKKVMTGQEGSSHSNKASVTQHIKSSHTYSYNDSQSRSRISGSRRQDIGGHITRKRLTRGVGLFNPGKKSKTVHRAPLPVPESVERDVEKTLKEILTKDDDSDVWSHQSVDTNVTESAPVPETRSSYHSFSVNPESNSGDLGKEKTSVYSLSPSPGVADTATVVSSEKSSGGLINVFRKKVPYNETACTMLSYLDAQCKDTFKKRDKLADDAEAKDALRLLSVSCALRKKAKARQADVDKLEKEISKEMLYLLTETCSELKKLIQQNQCTPEMKTSGGQEGDGKSTGSSSVRQSLVRSYSSLSPDKPSTEDVEIQPVIGYLSISDDSVTNAGHTHPHSVGIHGHHNRSTNSSRSTPEESLSFNQLPNPSQSYPQSMPSRSNLQPSQPVLSSHAAQSSERIHFTKDLSALSLPSVSEPLQPLNSHSVDFSVKPMLDLPLAAAASSGDKNYGLSVHRGPFGQPLKLFQEKGVLSELRDRTQPLQTNSFRKEDSCDIHWKVTDRSQNRMQHNSDDRFLRCKEFIARVSSLCGEASPTEENAMQITLQRHAYGPPSASSYRGDHSGISCRGDHPAVTCRGGRSATVVKESSVDKDEGHKSFLSKVMGQSFTQSPPEQLSLHPESHQRQAEMLGSCSGDNYFMSHYSLPGVSLDVSDRKDLADPYHKTTCTSQNAESYYHHEEDDIDRDLAFSSQHTSDLLNHLDVLPQQYFEHQQRPVEEEDNSFPCDSREWHYGCCQSDSILPPLKKPSLDTPSPPQKLSPHKWY